MKKSLIVMAAMLLMAGFSPCYGQAQTGATKSAKKVTNTRTYAKGSPSGVMTDYMDAMKKMDARKAANYENLPADRVERRVAKYERMFARDKDTKVMYKDGELKIFSEKVTGTEAVLEISLSLGAQCVYQTVRMVKVNGPWKIQDMTTHEAPQGGSK